MIKQWLRRALGGLFSGVAGALFVWLLLNLSFFSEFFYRMESATYDRRLRKFVEPPNHPIEDVVIIDIDGRTLKKLGSLYQWPRTEWAKALQILSEGNARLIGLDLIFDPHKRFPDEDQAFIEAMKAHGGVFNSLVLTQADPEGFLDAMAAEPPGFEARRFRRKVPEELRQRLPRYERLGPDFPELLHAGAGVGVVNLSEDLDGVLRRIPLFMRFNDHVYPTLGLSMALRDLQVDSVTYHPEKNLLRLKTAAGPAINIPVDQHGRALIYYQGPYRTFRYISFYSLLYELYELREKNNMLEFFRDKVVFIGSSAPGLSDLRATPRQPSFPGVEVHANVFYQILNQQFIRELSATQQFLLILLTGLIAGSLFALLYPLGGAAASLAIIVAIGVVAWGAFATHLVWIPIIAPMLTTLLTYTLHYSYRFIIEERDKREIKKIFSRYVSSSVVDELLKQPSLVKLGGEKKECTILFSDLAGFTSLAEKTPPEDLVKLLNQYLNAMTPLVLENQGTLDKYEGDAIMAIFGAPVDIPNHPLQACRTALQMEQLLDDIRRDWQQRGLPELHQRIGINTGQMVIGNMGSDVRFDYTAIGDSVNLGARLESANKLYGTRILISDYTYQKVRDQVIARQLDLLRVRGKREPVKVYELIALQDDPLDIQTREILTYFQQGYQHYLARNWDWAMNQFRQVLQINGDDQPARLYLFRCQEFLRHPPEKDWDGVYTLK